MSASIEQQQQHHQHEVNGRTVTPTAAAWNIQASSGSLNTTNPIREIIETMNLAENPEKKVIPLSIGDPTIFGNLKPCKEISDALDTAYMSGKYFGYQIAAGMESARESVAGYHYRCTGNKVRKEDVILASGCSHAIDLSICVLANKGRNILIPRPGFPLYKTLTSVYGVQYKQYNLLADNNWSIDLDHLESLIDDKTAAIIISNPSNPCGSVFSREHLLQILKLAEKYKIPIIADEIYDKFVFSPTTSDKSCHVPFISISSLSDIVPVLTCGGISKTCLIPGLRLGWVIINDKQNIFGLSVRNGLNRLTQRLMGPSSLVQGALPDILSKVPENFYTQTMDFIYKNAKFCYKWLQHVEGLHPYMPQGSMYLMVRFDAKSFPTIDGDLDFTSKLMNEESVLVLPGKCFDFPNFFRICLTVPTNVMEEALERIKEFCGRHHCNWHSTTHQSTTKSMVPNNKYNSHPLISKVTVSNYITTKQPTSNSQVNNGALQVGETTISELGPLLKLSSLSSANNIIERQASKCK